VTRSLCLSVTGALFVQVIRKSKTLSHRTRTPGHFPLLFECLERFPPKPVKHFIRIRNFLQRESNSAFEVSSPLSISQTQRVLCRVYTRRSSQRLSPWLSPRPVACSEYRRRLSPRRSPQSNRRSFKQLVCGSSPLCKLYQSKTSFIAGTWTAIIMYVLLRMATSGWIGMRKKLPGRRGFKTVQLTSCNSQYRISLN